MNLKLFKKEYEKNGVLLSYPLLKEIFEKPLTKEFIKKFDPTDVIIDFFNEAQKFKQFEKEIEFAKIIKENHPNIFKEVQQYIDDDLIDYYLYNNNKDKIEEHIDNFIDNPIDTIDYFLIVFKKLVFYSQMDLADKMIIKCFDEIENSKRLVFDPTSDLRSVKFNLIVEEDFSNNKVIKYTELSNRVEKFGMNINKELLPLLNLSLSSFTKVELMHKFTSNRNDFLTLMGVLFPKYAKSKNITFSVSDIIYKNIISLLDKSSRKKEINPHKFFLLSKNKFDTFLSKLSGGMFLNNIHEVFCVLWGSYYLFDFFKSINLIDENTYESNIEIINSLKNILLDGNKPALWKYSFINNWFKPDGMDNETFNYEKNNFIDSYLLIPKK